MSLSNFCHHCGKQLLAGAKWCSFCGVSLSSLSNKPEPPPEPEKPKFVLPTMGSEDDEEDDGDSLQHFDLRISALAVDFTPDPIEKMSFAMNENAPKKKRGRPSKS